VPRLIPVIHHALTGRATLAKLAEAIFMLFLIYPIKRICLASGESAKAFAKRMSAVMSIAICICARVR
jgi:hypothetical protein